MSKNHVEEGVAVFDQCI